MFIVPITKMPEVESLGSAAEMKSLQTEDTKGLSFQDILKNAFNNVEETQSASDQADRQLASGGVDDLHTALIQAEQAATAVEFTTQLTSKAVAAYNQIMGMQV